MILLKKEFIIVYNAFDVTFSYNPEKIPPDTVLMVIPTKNGKPSLFTIMSISAFTILQAELREENRAHSEMLGSALSMRCLTL